MTSRSTASIRLPSNRPWRAWIAPALLVTAVLACYGNSLSGPLVLDDYATLGTNPTLTDWSQALHPPANSPLGGRPLANLTFVLNRALGGDSVTSYHVGNLLIHVGAALAFFGVCRRTLQRVSPYDQGASDPTPTAFAIALVWAVHPVLTVSVSYLSQRTESLMGLGYFLTLYAFLRSLDSGAGPRLGWQAGSIAVCAAGMATKEPMVTAPLVVALYDWAFVAGSVAALWRARGRFYLGLGATWLLLAVLLGSGLAERQAGFGLGVSVPRYLLTEGHAILLYLKLAVWPHPLVFDYGAQFSTLSPLSLAEGAAVMLLLAGSLWLLARRPRVGFLAVAFFLLLAPTSSVVPVALQPIAENRLYLPLAAVVALLVAAGSRTPRIWRHLALGVVVVGLAALTIRRNRVFQSALTLWADNTVHRPQNSRGFANYALSLTFAGRTAESLPVYEHALQLEPDVAVNRGMYAGALLAVGRLDEAIREFRRTLELDPAIPTVRNNLGVALLRAGRYPEAVDHFTAAVRAHPDDSVAHQNLGLAYEATGQFDLALAEYEAVQRLQPGYAEAYNNHGVVLFRLGRLPESITQFERAVQLRPDYPEARQNLALARARAADGK